MNKKCFKEKYSFQKRSEESKRIKQKYPDRIPIIVEKSYTSNITDIDKNKFLVPFDLTFGQFQYVIRKKIQLPSDKAMFMFVKNIIPPTSSLISNIYESYADEDSFLYIIYSGENTFGK